MGQTPSGKPNTALGLNLWGVVRTLFFSAFIVIGLIVLFQQKFAVGPSLWDNPVVIGLSVGTTGLWCIYLVWMWRQKPEAEQTVQRNHTDILAALGDILLGGEETVNERVSAAYVLCRAGGPEASRWLMRGIADERSDVQGATFTALRMSIRNGQPVATNEPAYLLPGGVIANLQAEMIGTGLPVSRPLVHPLGIARLFEDAHHIEQVTKNAEAMETSGEVPDQSNGQASSTRSPHDTVPLSQGGANWTE